VRASNPSAVCDAIAQANTLLAQDGTLPQGIKPSSDVGHQMISVAADLERYNVGKLTPGCTPRN